ncbi:phosphate ABC transporter permease subunit PstC [Wolbachia endosymbiont of Litomosoides brasiliensis]|uniref:phosphate ABC transporter permease subunit PstC n=1 Tax=Wolbachia endosymbiont of Litomosoides brasiliensis TaxID=1812117 RepID=UPI00158AF018|nr:phosphate ABC transporter permease subunit PstC [Wolbachia endosymbiont of Litomosoides brasiliensis]NUY39538.1 phosphate ABC transporter permease subunit PstC [Wolbachia endosymbiont of Litomosoides brasiliensis]
MNLLTIILFSIPVLLILLFCFNKFQKVDKVKFYLCLSYVWVLTWLLILCDNCFITFVFITFLSFVFAFIFKGKRSKVIKFTLFVALAISFFITLFIMLSILTQSIEFFKRVSISEFLFCLKWGHSVVTINEEKVGCFGVTPLLVGTLVITIVAILVAVPLGLFSAIYISEYASEKVRYIVNTTLQVLSAIPTVVYGYFSVVFLSSFVKRIANFFGFNIHSESALVAGLSVGIMILPFIISLLEDAIRSVPKSLRYGFMALGATPAETIWHITIPYAMPTILSAILLSISRVIGETMIVLMAVGINSNLTFNPLNSVTTITVQTATLLTGDQGFNSVQTLAAYALSLVLFIITWLLNVFALFIIKRN